IEENPICISCLQSSQRQSPPPKDSFLHQRYLFEIEHLVPVNHQDKRLRLHGIAPLCAIIGVGTGHIIEQITQQYDIQNLLIYEPDPDVFYASLFTTRYTTIARHYQTNYRTLTFIIGANSSAFCNRVDALFQQQGHFLLARFLLIEHRPTPDTRTAITHLRNIIHRSVRGWGFFEDEIISVSQSLHNLQHGTPLIGPLSPKAHDALHNMPVFVVANGPSLDHDIDFIKAHSQTAVIVSVGSTIYTLYRHNIKPDFHVEIERSPAVGTYLERLTDPSYRQDVTLLTQNPIHPSVIAQFSRTLISLKVNDAGTGLMQLLYPNQIDENWPVYFTHPLVGNGGVATLVRLGFTNLYLFGMDMCFSHSGQHHSKDSPYYDQDEQRLPLSANTTTRHYREQTNFNSTETAATSSLFDTSRFAIEALIAENPAVSITNCSDGIRIRGTHSTPSADLALPQVSADAKQRAITFILNQAHPFTGHAHELKKRYQRAQQPIAELGNGLCRLWPNKLSDMRTLTETFIEQRALLPYFYKKDPLTKQMFNGSLRYLQLYVYQGALYFSEGEELQCYLTQARDVFMRYIHSMLTLSGQYFDA
ncbi:MAG: DUF115 domain-containing protein, partial [Gammaproteobacteria bacterium]